MRSFDDDMIAIRNGEWRIMLAVGLEFLIVAVPLVLMAVAIWHS